MAPAFRPRFPELEPMYAALETASVRGRSVAERGYLVMGQVCVDADFRGSGVFEGLYAKLRELHAPAHELLVTEIAARNGRSLRAHAKVGFEVRHRHREPSGEEWCVVVWDWRQG